MKKYLLLASTALLFSTNAWAGEVAPDGQSATMGVDASLKVVSGITDVTDMHFATIYVPGSISEGDEIASLGTDSTISLYEGLATSGTPAAGTVTFSHVSDANYTVTCGDDADDGGCILEGMSGSALSVHVTPSTGTITGSETVSYGGDLYFITTGTTSLPLDFAGTIQITLSY